MTAAAPPPPGGAAAWRGAAYARRHYVSLGLVALFVGLAYGVVGGRPAFVEAGTWLGLTPQAAHRVGCLGVSVLVAAASLLRMAAGSALGASRVMSETVRAERLVVTGPYGRVRNPIYLADLLAITALASALPTVGMLLPPLLALHYGGLVRHEERAFGAAAPEAFAAYVRAVPRWRPRLSRAPTLASPAGCASPLLTWEGVRHNALYALFVPAFALAAGTGDERLALGLGLPAVLDWALAHHRRRRDRVVPPPPGPTAVDEPRLAGEVLYAQCWEDPEVGRAALAIRPGDTVLCITSGGCKALAYLLDDPARVIAVDANPAQAHLLALKSAALAALDHEALLAFVGARGARANHSLYAQVRPALGAVARAFWDARQPLLAAGLLDAGRFEGYVRLIRTWLRRLVGRSAMERVRLSSDAAARARWCERHWQRGAVRWLTEGLLSRRTMSALFTPSFFTWVDPDLRFGRHFRGKVERALVDPHIHSGSFLSWIWLGRYPEGGALPAWLRSEHQATLRERLHRVQAVTGDLGHALDALAPGSVAAFDFSNVFEWMPPEAHADLLRRALRVAAPGARMVGCNLLVPRGVPEAFAPWIEHDAEASRRLSARDQAFLYERTVVARVRAKAAPWA